MVKENRKVFKTEVRSDAEGFELPETACFVIDESAAREIVNLAGLIKAHGLHQVEKLDNRVTYYKDSRKEVLMVEDEEGTHLDRLIVTETEFRYSGCLTRAAAEISTDNVSIAELVKHFGFDASNDAEAEFFSFASPGI